jgi:hypothetical protein
MRSAITVAGMSGVTDNNRRICGSKASTAEPRPGRAYCGGSAERNAERTVLRARPNRRAIARTAILSAKNNLRISAHSSNSITSFLPCRPRPVDTGSSSKPRQVVDPRKGG